MGITDLSVISNVTEASSIPDAFWRAVRARPNGLLFTSTLVSPSDRSSRLHSSHSYSDVAPRVARLANYLLTQGLQAGDRVAIISHSRTEWCISDMAVLSAGGVVVSIYQSLTPEEAGYILFDSGASFVFAENQEQVGKIEELTEKPFMIPAREDRPAEQATLSIKGIVTFEKVVSSLPTVHIQRIFDDSSISDNQPTAYKLLKRESLASLVYTSGTTGPSKGVVQSHGNHLANVFQATKAAVFSVSDTLFLYLPLAHSFARLVYYVGVLTPASLCFPAVADTQSSKVDLASVTIDLRESNSFAVPSVPRLFEKIASTIRFRAEQCGLQARILRWCLTNSEHVYESQKTGKHVGVFSQIVYRGLAPIREKIKRQIFGRNFSHAISGGAKLNPEVNCFFDALGITILEGYGLTETCVATHVNRLDNRRIGSVGPALEGVVTKIDPADGEILIKGPNVTSCYWNRPQATREAYIEDGWFRTGDIGKIEDGFLYITDRKKDIIVTAGGKKIPPQSIEALFGKCPYISQVVVFGDGKPYCVALVTLNESEVRGWLTASAITPSGPLNEDPQVRALIQKEFERVNSNLASYESIKKFAILPQDFTIENGLLTPTLKVRRKLVFSAIAILAAVLTPTPDVVNMVLMGLPLYVLYEAGIVLIQLFQLDKKNQVGKDKEWEGQ